MSKVYESNDFRLGADGTGVPFDDFVTALNVWLFSHDGWGTVRGAALAFNVTDATVCAAVEDHPWMFISGPDDDPSKQIIEHDGE